MSIVVGVSRRRTSEAALRWAAAEAARDGAPLVVVRAWRPTAAEAGSRTTDSVGPHDRRTAHEAAERQLHDDVASVLGADHGAQVVLAFGGKRRALLEAARDADLLVVEAPRLLDRGPGPGLVARLTAAASCPVVVVPRDDASPVRRAAGRVVEGAGRAPRPGLSHPKP